MAIPSGDLLRLTIGGSVPSDTWSVSLWFKLTGLSATPSPTAMNSTALNAVNGFNTVFWSNAVSPWKAQCATSTTLATSKLYLYRSSALVQAGTGSITPVAGTGSVTMPGYVARVVSLLTDQPGRSRRGRIYLPSTGAGVNSGTGLFASVSGAMTNLATILGSTSGYQSTGYFFGGSEVAELCVVSSTHGYTTSVTSLRCDNKPDTQHGRENKLIATINDAVSV